MDTRPRGQIGTLPFSSVWRQRGQGSVGGEGFLARDSAEVEIRAQQEESALRP
jgi:hypothetical protein